jgi:hypothetical protein
VGAKRVGNMSYAGADTVNAAAPATAAHSTRDNAGWLHANRNASSTALNTWSLDIATNASRDA